MSRSAGLQNSTSLAGWGKLGKKYRPKPITAMIGKAEAKVTTPKPPAAPPSPPCEATREMPMPRANTSGTVTGPVVTPPQSHASPVRCTRLGSK